ncbi:hypothetical protein DFJ74DRAFT_102022, partial [Hyaloraphidium curvatum]
PPRLRLAWLSPKERSTLILIARPPPLAPRPPHDDGGLHRVAEGVGGPVPHAAAVPPDGAGPRGRHAAAAAAAARRPAAPAGQRRRRPARLRALLPRRDAAAQVPPHPGLVHHAALHHAVGRQRVPVLLHPRARGRRRRQDLPPVHGRLQPRGDGVDAGVHVGPAGLRRPGAVDRGRQPLLDKKLRRAAGGRVRTVAAARRVGARQPDHRARAGGPRVPVPRRWVPGQLGAEHRLGVLGRERVQVRPLLRLLLPPGLHRIRHLCPPLLDHLVDRAPGRHHRPRDGARLRPVPPRPDGPERAAAADHEAGAEARDEARAGRPSGADGGGDGPPADPAASRRGAGGRHPPRSSRPPPRRRGGPQAPHRRGGRRPAPPRGLRRDARPPRRGLEAARLGRRLLDDPPRCPVRGGGVRRHLCRRGRLLRAAVRAAGHVLPARAAEHGARQPDRGQLADRRVRGPLRRRADPPPPDAGFPRPPGPALRGGRARGARRAARAVRGDGRTQQGAVRREQDQPGDHAGDGGHGGDRRGRAVVRAEERGAVADGGQPVLHVIGSGEVVGGCAWDLAD